MQSGPDCLAHAGLERPHADGGWAHANLLAVAGGFFTEAFQGLAATPLLEVVGNALLPLLTLLPGANVVGVCRSVCGKSLGMRKRHQGSRSTGLRRSGMQIFPGRFGFHGDARAIWSLWCDCPRRLGAG